ncbi:MAG: YCF48-related protein [bacterium]
MHINKYKFSILLISIASFTILTGQGCFIFSSNKNPDGGIYRSDNGGLDWEQKGFIGTVKKETLTINSYSAGRIIFHPTDPNIIYFGTLGNGIYRTDDGGERWQITGRQTGTVKAMGIDANTPEILYAGNGSNIDKTSDGGVTWQRVYTESRPELTLSYIVVDQKNTSHILAGNSGGVLLESDDYGQTWQVNHDFLGDILRIYIHPNDNNAYFIISSNGGLQRSDDRGITWTSLNSELSKYPGAKKIYDLDFDPRQPSRIYIASQYGLLKSEDLGNSWEAPKTLIPNNTQAIRNVVISHENPNIIYITTSDKFHISKDSGETWEVISPPTNRLINRLEQNPINGSQLFIGTYLEK